jgi:hypothetical protein
VSDDPAYGAPTTGICHGTLGRPSCEVLIRRYGPGATTLCADCTAVLEARREEARRRKREARV